MALKIPAQELVMTAEVVKSAGPTRQRITRFPVAVHPTNDFAAMYAIHEPEKDTLYYSYGRVDGITYHSENSPKPLMEAIAEFNNFFETPPAPAA